LVIVPGNSKEYRDSNPGYKERNNLLNKLRTRALRELASRHQIEFLTIFEAMKAEAGVK
jgi:hypothetical protein